MPSYAAGPRPATVRLAQTSSQCIKETLNRYLPLPSSATRPANSVAPKPQIIARNRVRPRRSHKPSRSNLHSAPPTPRIPYRGFLPWRLSDAGPGASRIVPMGRHPKPFTKTVIGPLSKSDRDTVTLIQIRRRQELSWNADWLRSWPLTRSVIAG